MADSISLLAIGYWLLANMEGWPSGRRRMFGVHVSELSGLGFESLIFRNLYIGLLLIVGGIHRFLSVRLEDWPSGWRRTSRTRVFVKSESRVRIPNLPCAFWNYLLCEQKIFLIIFFDYFWYSSKNILYIFVISII